MTTETTPEAGVRLVPETQLDPGAHELVQVAQCLAMSIESVENWHDDGRLLAAHCHATVLIEDLPAMLAAPVAPAVGGGEAITLTFASLDDLAHALRGPDVIPWDDSAWPEDFKNDWRNRARHVIALAARAQPPVGEVDLAAMREYAVEMTKKHGNPIGTDYEQGQNDMGYRWVHSFDDLPAAHPAEPAARREQMAVAMGNYLNSLPSGQSALPLASHMARGFVWNLVDAALATTAAETGAVGTSAASEQKLPHGMVSIPDPGAGVGDQAAKVSASTGGLK